MSCLVMIYLPHPHPGKPGAYPQWGWGPRLVYAELPMNVVQSGDALFTSLAGSNKLALQLSWYRHYPPPLNVLQDQSLIPSFLKKMHVLLVLPKRLHNQRHEHRRFTRVSGHGPCECGYGSGRKGMAA